MPRYIIRRWRSSMGFGFNVGACNAPNLETVLLKNKIVHPDDKIIMVREWSEIENTWIIVFEDERTMR